MYTHATSLDHARAAGAEIRAGGTDLQERLRTGVAAVPIVDVSGITGLRGIEVHDGGAEVGALSTIGEVGSDTAMQRSYPALTLPCQLLATPQTRARGTMGGALCQRTRCWYYRDPAMPCPKKGDHEPCPSRSGNHHFGVCFDLGPCVHPHPSSVGCALLTYDAELSVDRRGRIPIADLYGDGSALRDHLLEPGEMITAIHLPSPVADERGGYQRLMSRALAEWPLVEVVVRLVIADGAIALARVAVGGVANIPFRLTQVEEALESRSASDDVLAEAAEQATRRATPLPQTAYKVPMVEALVLSTLQAARDDGSGTVDVAI